MRMSNPARLLAALALITCLSAGAQAQTPVGKVIEIKGPKLDYKRGAAAYVDSFIGQETRIKDSYKTDEATVAALEFITGGRVGINKGTTIEIVSESDVKDETGKPLVKRVRVTGGRIWAKMGKRKDTLEIETSGGVMGIKGTEFVIETQESGPTRVAVLEGEVEVQPVTGGPAIVARPGTDVTIPWQQVPVVRTVDPEQLREEILNSQEWKDFQTALSVANMFSGYVPGLSEATGAAYDAIYYGQIASDLITNPGETVANYAASYANSYIPGPFGISTGSSKPKIDFPTEPNPPEGSAVTSPPTFSWKGIDGGADSYLILLSKDPQMGSLEWSNTVKATTVTYPATAHPLDTGTYYWRVMGLDDERKPQGKATQTSFQCQSWAAPTPPADPAAPGGAAPTPTDPTAPGGTTPAPTDPASPTPAPARP